MNYAAYATTIPGFGDFDVTVMSPGGEPVCTIELEVRDGHVVTDLDDALAAEGWRVRGEWSTTDFGGAATVVRR